METIPRKTLPPFDAKILALIAAAKGEWVGEDEVRHAMFPAPAYPTGAKVGSPEYAAWLVTQRAWQDRAFSGNGIEYRDCYASICGCALIRLIKAKLILEHNNGYNVGSYSIAT